MRAKRLALLVFATSLLLTMTGPPRNVYAASAVTAPESLSVSTSMKVLPADGATYPAVIVSLQDHSGAPTVALNDTLVYLASSQEAVGEVTSTLTIKAGRSFAVANFTTTRNPGSAQVVASATGLQPSTVTVNTGTATGYPDQLRITAVPSTAAAEPNSQGSLIVELLDDSGLPAKAVRDTNVTFYSSNPEVLNITQNAVIETGQFIEMVNYTTGSVPGSSVITASASGFQPGSTAVTVLGPAALVLKVYAQPTTMPTCAPPAAQSCTGRLVVALLDLVGDPVRAPRNMTVFVRSSNLSVVQVPLDYDINITAGSMSAVGSFSTTSYKGSAIVTVSSPNRQSDFVTITTMPASTRPQSLKLYIGPSTVLADHSSYSSVIVSLTNKTGFPSTSVADLNVTLTSSVAAIGNITKVFLTVPAGRSYAKTNITSTYQVGTTVITASAQNLLSDQAEISTFGAIPSKIVVQALSPELPADGSSHLALVVMLEDSFGEPAITPVGVPVNLTSSHNDIASVTSKVIPAGQSFAIILASTGVLPGTANVTAVAALNASYSFSSTLVNTVIPSPSKLVASVDAGSAFLSSMYGPTLVVQLQDASGDPARAREVTNVTITSSNSTVIGQTLDMQIAPGADYGTLTLPANATGTTTLTIFSQGLTPASVSLALTSYPLQVQISSSSMTILANETAALTATVTLDGIAVPGLPLNWSVTNGLLKNTNATTGNGGISLADFSPQAPGSSKVTATLGNSTFGVTKTSVTIYVLPAAQNSKPGLLQSLTTFPLVLAPVGAAVGGAFVAFIVLRRRRGVEEVTEEGYESSPG